MAAILDLREGGPGSLRCKAAHRACYAVVWKRVENALVLVTCLLKTARVVKSHSGFGHPAALDISATGPQLRIVAAGNSKQFVHQECTGTALTESR